MDEDQRPKLTEATVRKLAKTRSYERGESYYQKGAVGDVFRRGDRLRADVQGSSYHPYTVTVEFDDAGVARTECSCPYNHGGICKHRVAVLLTYIRDTDTVTHERPVEGAVADADRETLEEVVVELVERQPEAADSVLERLDEEESENQKDVEGESGTSVDLNSVRRRAEHALPNPGRRGRGDAHAEATRMAEEIDGLVEQARKAIEEDDGETALDVLGTVADVLTQNRWMGHLPHETPDVYEALDDLGEAFTEAVLTADLTESERADWENRLHDWDDELRRFTGVPTLSAAAEAAAEGWDVDRVRKAMEGSLEEGEFWEGGEKPRRHAEGVVEARLAVLERQGRTEEFLKLAVAAGQTRAYTRMLVESGRTEEAVDKGTERLSSPSGYLELAETLREHDRTEEALAVAERGLAEDGSGKAELAEWLRDSAESAGESDLALEGAVAAFKASPSLRSYRAVEEVARDGWEDTRPELLDFLREQETNLRNAVPKTEIFLHEEMYDEAIEVAESIDRAEVVEPVVKAVMEERPVWAMDACRAQAEPIIEQGKHDSYETAVLWLERAGEAAEEADELDEWRAYVEDILDEHYQKYKLRPMLEDLLEEF